MKKLISTTIFGSVGFVAGIIYQQTRQHRGLSFISWNDQEKPGPSDNSLPNKDEKNQPGFTSNKFDEVATPFAPKPPVNKREKFEIYAELISDRGLPADIPPIKVIINAAIAETAAVSIKDSQLVANQVSKSLLLDFLANPKSTGQFGTFLNDLFTYESLLASTRQLIYWAIFLPDVYQQTYDLAHYQTLAWSQYGLKDLATSQMIAWLLWPETRHYYFAAPLVQLSKDRDYIINPLDHVVKESIISAKDVSKDALKDYLQETLKSEQTKTLVRDTVVSIIRAKIAPVPSEIEEPAKSTATKTKAKATRAVGEILDKSIQGKLDVATSKKQASSKTNIANDILQSSEQKQEEESSESNEYNHYDRFDRDNDWGG